MLPLSRKVGHLDIKNPLRLTCALPRLADASSGRICLVNRRDQALVYDSQGNQLADFHMGSPLRFAAFKISGARLLLLTADQKVHTMEVSPPPS